MAINAKPLPYPLDALEPHVSSQTLAVHHGKHYRGYVNKLNKAIAGTDLDRLALVDIVRRSADTAVFNNAAQAWNHEFYFDGMTAEPAAEMPADLRAAIEKHFDSVDAMRDAFIAAAASQFGSGWAWLVLDGASIDIVTSGNADTPLTAGLTPLLTCDVWEHAYYLDYQNERPRYLEHFFSVVNWEFVAQNYRAVTLDKAA